MYCVVVFVCIILVLAVFVVTKIFTGWDVVSDTMGSGEMSIIVNAVINSFSLVGLMIVIDVVAGLLVEWLMV